MGRLFDLQSFNQISTYCHNTGACVKSHVGPIFFVSFFCGILSTGLVTGIILCTTEHNDDGLGGINTTLTNTTMTNISRNLLVPANMGGNASDGEPCQSPIWTLIVTSVGMVGLAGTVACIVATSEKAKEIYSSIQPFTVELKEGLLPS